MARPKSTAPTKTKLTLSVSAQTRLELDYISQAQGRSISQIVADWAAKESKRLARQAGKETPDAQQLTIESLK